MLSFKCTAHYMICMKKDATSNYQGTQGPAHCQGNSLLLLGIVINAQCFKIFNINGRKIDHK